MLFPTFDYLAFLALTATLHAAVRGVGARAAGLVGVSLLFYTAWNPADLPVLLGVITVAWLGGLALPRLSGNARAIAPFMLAAALLAPMVASKTVGGGWMPVGVSFWSFQALGYVVDVHRGRAPERNPVRFATFLLFFPHLVAGPILRAGDMLAQVSAVRVVTRRDVTEGLLRIAVGWVKKRLFADVLKVGIVTSVFADPGAFSGLEVMVALYAYTLQIYLDFSGYSDLAIGSARLFGFRLPENFDRPYLSTSIAEYWTRWHQTLSAWVKDYLYFPLGGSRRHVTRNTLITLEVLALWHGFSWNFALYGLVHGVGVAVTRAWRTGPGARITPGPVGIAVRWAATFHVIVLARILFKTTDLSHAAAVTSALFDPVLAVPRFSTHAAVVLVLGYVAHFSPPAWAAAARDRLADAPPWLIGAGLAAVGALTPWLGVGPSLGFVYDRF